MLLMILSFLIQLIIIVIINLGVLIRYHYMINLMYDSYQLINANLNHLHIVFTVLIDH